MFEQNRENWLVNNVICNSIAFNKMTKEIQPSLPTSPLSKILALLKGSVTEPGHLRDALLIAGGVIYFLGYLTWTAFAVQNNLGPISVIEAQYFAAGLVTFAFCFMVLFVTEIAIRLFIIPKEWLMERSVKFQKLFNTSLVVICLGLFLYLSIIGVREQLSDKLWFYFLLAAFGLIFSFLLYVSSEGEDSHQVRSVRLYLGQTLLVFLFIPYINVIYARIPQEFGGGEPKCAALDIVVANVSQQTTAALTASPPSTADDKDIIRTVPLKILRLTGGTSVIFLKQEGTSQDQMIEIKQDAISAFTWLDETECLMK